MARRSRGRSRKAASIHGIDAEAAAPTLLSVYLLMRSWWVGTRYGAYTIAFRLPSSSPGRPDPASQSKASATIRWAIVRIVDFRACQLMLAATIFDAARFSITTDIGTEHDCTMTSVTAAVT